MTLWARHPSGELLADASFRRQSGCLSVEGAPAFHSTAAKRSTQELQHQHAGFLVMTRLWRSIVPATGRGSALPERLLRMTFAVVCVGCAAAAGKPGQARGRPRFPPRQPSPARVRRPLAGTDSSTSWMHDQVRPRRPGHRAADGSTGRRRATSDRRRSSCLACTHNRSSPGTEDHRQTGTGTDN